MPHYAVMIEATNLLLEIDDKLAKYGYFVTYRLSAATAAEAEEQALQAAADDTEVAELLRNLPDDPPTYRVDESSEVSDGDAGEFRVGRAWFAMDPTE